MKPSTMLRTSPGTAMRSWRTWLWCPTGSRDRCDKTVGAKLTYITLLWMLLMVGIDQSQTLNSDTKVVVFDRNRIERNAGAPAYYPWRIFDAEPPAVDLPELRVMARGTTADHELLTRIVSYYRQHEAALQREWREQNRQRLQAFYAMNLIHLSHPYGADRLPGGLLDYVNNMTASSCRHFAMFQSRILDAFGLPWRYVAVSSGFHGWIEVQIGARWEVFDATGNVWIDRPAFELLDGEPRRYRLFYTPWADADRPDARAFVERFEPHFFQTGSLRMHMPGFGIYFMTASYMQEKGLRLEVWPNFCPGASKGPACATV